MSKLPKKRYSAKLMFQWRNEDMEEKFFHTEERIVVFESTSAKRAIKMARTIGKKCDFDYQTDDFGRVFFEFIGLMDVVDIDFLIRNGKPWDEVWYDVKTRFKPMERKDKFVKTDEDLLRRI